MDDRSNGQKLALKLISFRRLCRPSRDMVGNACTDADQEHPQFSVIQTKSIEKRLALLRLEHAIVRCLTGLNPFIAGLKGAGANGFTTVCDCRKGEVGFTMELMCGSLEAIWADWAERSMADKTEDTAKDFREMTVFVMAQLADAVRFLQCCQIVHHDIAPSNVLMDKTGYVKLTDFGQAFVLGRPRSNSVSSANNTSRWTGSLFGPPEDVWWSHSELGQSRSSDPMAPSPDLDRALDLHKLGYTVYRLGYPVSEEPWYAEVDYDVRRNATFDHFLTGYSLTFRPGNIRGVLKSFADSLLAPRPESRLGYWDPWQLIGHPVFADIDFDELRARQMVPPINGTLRSILDCGGVVAVEDYEQQAPWLDGAPEAEFAERLSEDQRLFYARTFQNSDNPRQ